VERNRVPRGRQRRCPGLYRVAAYHGACVDGGVLAAVVMDVQIGAGIGVQQDCTAAWCIMSAGVDVSEL